MEGASLGLYGPILPVVFSESKTRGSSSMSDTKFADGMIVKDKREQAPDFVKCHVSIKVEEFIQTLRDNERDGWVNIDILRSKQGKLYAKIDDWLPTQGTAAKEGMTEARAAAEPDGFEDDIPFSNYEYRTLA